MYCLLTLARFKYVCYHDATIKYINSYLVPASMLPYSNKKNCIFVPHLRWFNTLCFPLPPSLYKYLPVHKRQVKMGRRGRGDVVTGRGNWRSQLLIKANCATDLQSRVKDYEIPCNQDCWVHVCKSFLLTV